MTNSPWLCKAGQQLREQLDDSYPDRDRTSDGWIGDARHSHLKSDHNPDKGAKSVVRAIDLDRDLCGKSKPDLMPYLADQIRLCAKSGDLRIKYIIFDGRIASSRGAGLGENILEAIATSLIFISALRARVISMARSLIYP